METFEKGAPVPASWYSAPNLKPLEFRVAVEADIIAGYRNVWPVRPMGEGDYVIWSEGAIDPKQDSPLHFDPPCHIHAVPRHSKGTPIQVGG